MVKMKEAHELENLVCPVQGELYAGVLLSGQDSVRQPCEHHLGFVRGLEAEGRASGLVSV